MILHQYPVIDGNLCVRPDAAAFHVADRNKLANVGAAKDGRLDRYPVLQVGTDRIDADLRGRIGPAARTGFWRSVRTFGLELAVRRDGDVAIHVAAIHGTVFRLFCLEAGQLFPPRYDS